MERQSIQYKTEDEWLQLRTKDLTSTDIGALFGINPYCTEFELWHQKKEGQIVDYKEEEWTKWGKRLESSIAEGIAKDNCWKVEPITEYMRIPEIRIGSSFDYKYSKPMTASEIEAKEKSQPFNSHGILEVKNVLGFIFKDQWIKHDDGTYESPPHIEIQAQHQMLVRGCEWLIIAALVNGNQVQLIERQRDENICNAIMEKAAAFWKSIDENKPPQPNFAQDAKFLSTLYGFTEPGSVIDACDDQDMLTRVKAYVDAGEKIKILTHHKEELKGKILFDIKNAEKVISPYFSISTGQVKSCEVSYTRKGYRMFKITPKKALKELQ